MKADRLEDKVRRFIDDDRLLAPDDRVLVALSGGADSVALLHLMLTLKAEGKLAAVEAAHLHHGLRGKEADRDAAFVKTLCAAWQVPLHFAQVDVAALAAKERLGIEAAGRQARYAFLESVPDIDRIATAHTATDNAETLLLHMARGCGLSGLTGIAPRRGRLVRPLLNGSREEVEAYCAAHGLDYVTDSTNADVQYSRNRVRHQVLPALRELNPSLEEAVTRLTRLCTQDAAYLEQQADTALASLSRDDYGRLSAAEMTALPPALRGRVWQRLLTPLGRSPTFEEIGRLDALLTRPGALSLNESCRVTASGGSIEIAFAENVAPVQEPIPLKPGGTYEFGGRRYAFDLVPLAEIEKFKFVHKNVLNYAFDYATISRNLRLTVRQEGDFLHPAGRGCKKTLKKLFNEQCVPVSVRAEMPVLRDDEGIVLLPGFACDERVRVTPQTNTVALFRPIKY